MFSYLRYFSAISLVLVVLAAYLVGIYFKSIASQDVEDLVKRNNAALAQGYINSTWKKHSNVLQRLNRISVTKWNKYREFRRFKEETLRYFEEMPIAKVTIYTTNGGVILSSQATEKVLSNKAARDNFAAASDGEITSRILRNATYILPNGETEQGTLVQTFIPILSDYFVPIVADQNVKKTEAIIELNYNVTPQWQKLTLFQFVATGGIISIFVILILVLFFSSRRAESIIAKQHEINLELTAAAAAAEAENRDKSQFLANISHELRTPLNAIIGFSEILRNETTTILQGTHKEYLNDIHSSGSHLLSLINDILEYSKAEAGKLEVDISEIDAVKMIKNSMRLVLPRAEEAQVTLMEDLPSKHFILQTDAKKLKQVLLNLLSNAVKFTPAGGEVRISAWLDEPSDKVSFEVKDTGIGISAKDISRVMTPFGQVDSTLARRFEGTGLGLPLSKKLVEIMGGEFDIQSEVNKGTTITLTFPRSFSKEAYAGLQE
jgi:two-component system cell cycle sensor histidine kinase PleC